MELDPDTYHLIVEHHKKTRPEPLPQEESEDYTDAACKGQSELNTMTGHQFDARGSGEGSTKEPKKPELS